METCAQYARSHQLSCITLQGDQADKKGVLTGGYHDSRRSRIDAVRGLSKWRVQYEELSNRAADIKRDLERKDQEITQVIGHLNKVESQRQQLVQGLGSLRDEIRSKVVESGNLQEAINAKVRILV